jgi:hypothetical protein
MGRKININTISFIARCGKNKKAAATNTALGRDNILELFLP